MKEAKKKNNAAGGEIKDTSHRTSPTTWNLNHTLPGSGANADCEYTVTLDDGRWDHDTGDYTAGYTASHSFDDRLTGIGGDDLQIDMDEAELEGGDKDISCIRLRSRLEDVVVLYGATITSRDGTSNRWLAELEDRTDPATTVRHFTGSGTGDAATDIAGGGVSFNPNSGVGGISVGGYVAGTENCPEGVDWDDPPGGGTTGSGDNQRGRLIWREIVR